MKMRHPICQFILCSIVALLFVASSSALSLTARSLVVPGDSPLEEGQPKGGKRRVRQ